jgi:hypothetical protein
VKTKTKTKRKRTKTKTKTKNNTKWSEERGEWEGREIEGRREIHSSGSSKAWSRTASASSSSKSLSISSSSGGVGGPAVTKLITGREEKKRNKSKRGGD